MSANMNSVPQSVITPNQIPATNPIVPNVAENKTSTTEKPSETEASKVLDSTRFNQLSKKEAQIVKERENLKKELEGFKTEKEKHLAEVEKLKAVHKQLTDFEALKSSDPIAAMKLAGFSEADLINFLAAAEENKPSPEEQALKLAKDEIEKFKTEQLTEKEKLQKEQETKVLQKFQKDISDFVSADKDKYEYCNFYGDAAQELIYQTVETVLNDTQEIISVQEAADLVEAYYEEQDKSMSTLKKRGFKKLLETDDKVAEKTPVVTDAPITMEKSTKRLPTSEYANTKTQTKTITNRSGATLANSIPAHLSPEENKQRIVEKYRSLK